jgi:hypothetical protein
MKEVFLVKKWNAQWCEWYYKSTRNDAFDEVVDSTLEYATYAEAQDVIRNAGPGIYAIDKIFVNK